MGGTHGGQSSRKGKGGMGSEAAHQGGRGTKLTSEQLSGLTSQQKKQYRGINDPAQRERFIAKLQGEKNNTSEKKEESKKGKKKKGVKM